MSSIQNLSADEQDELRRLRQRVAELEQREQRYQQQTETQSLYHEMLDNAPFLIFAKDLHGRVLFGNRMVEQLLGIPVANIIGKRDEDFLPADHAAHNMQTDQEVMTTRQVIQRDEPTLDANGVLHHYRSIKFPLFDEHGELYGVGSISTDMTDHMKAEQELRIFQRLVDKTQDSIGMASLDGKLIYANDAYQHVTGQQVGATVRDHFTPERAEELERVVLPMVIQQGKWEGLLTIRHPNGNDYIIQSSTFILKDTDDTPIAMANIFRDVTEWQIRDAELQTFQTVIDKVPYGIAFVSSDGIITYGNPAMKAMVGYGDELTGTPVPLLFGGNADIPMGVIQHVTQHGVWQGNVLYYRKDGSTFEANLTVFSILDDAGNIISFPGIVQDLTDVRRAEAERVALQEQIIQTQRHALLELSAPLLPISEHVIVMPLIGSIDTQRAQQIMETLLEGVVQYHADVVIVDITGVQVVDTQVANAIIQTAQAVQLLGARVVLTGIGPTMAQTLVSLGVDLSNIITRSRLQHGIAYAIQRGHGGE